mgnify:CR=1 FL=1
MMGGGATALRRLQRCFGGGPLRHICQAAAHELVVPKLGGDDRSEAHFHGESRQRSGPHKRCMIARTRLGRFFRGLLLHAIAASLIGYFALQAFQGNYGLEARKGYEEDIARLTREQTLDEAAKPFWRR